MSEIRFNGTTAPSARNNSPYWGEHVARYVFALPKIENRFVLDVACGTGYGLPFLQSKAHFVVGADIDWHSVRYAQDEIVADSAAVVVGSGVALPFVDNSFDVITSFETLEHLETRKEFLGELHRVMKQDGICLISTPNANYTQPINGKPRNPFHVHEYGPEELIAELHQYFGRVEIVGQTLNQRFAIPPFQEAQQQLPSQPGIQAKLFAWRVMNKIPLSLRETLSQLIWQEPFYPGERDYEFSVRTIDTAPVLVALCWRSEREER